MKQVCSAIEKAVIECVARMACIYKAVEEYGQDEGRNGRQGE